VSAIGVLEKLKIAGVFPKSNSIVDTTSRL